MNQCYRGRRREIEFDRVGVRWAGLADGQAIGIKVRKKLGLCRFWEY